MKKIFIITALVAALAVGAYSLTTGTTLVSDPDMVKSDAVVVQLDESLMVIKEGIHYDVLEQPLRLPAYNGAIITEFFWLGCPHCQNFEPQVINWKKMLNKDIATTVHKVAVPGSARWNTDAKVFYTMKELGASAEQITTMLGLYQKEAQQHKKYPTDERIKKFFADIGLDTKKAMNIFNDGSSLNDDLAMAKQEFLKLNASGVPVFVVNGKYKVRFDHIESNNDVYEILKALSNKK